MTRLSQVVSLNCTNFHCHEDVIVLGHKRVIFAQHIVETTEAYLVYTLILLLKENNLFECVVTA